MLNSTQHLLVASWWKSWDLLKFKLQESKKRGEEDDDEDGVPLHTLVNSLNHHSMKRTWKKEEEEKEREEERSAGMKEWTQMSSSTSYNPNFCIEPPSYFSTYNLSQMKGHLNQFMLNEIATTTKVNVLLEIYVRVSRVSVFDEIREISYLRKSSYIAWFSLKPFQFIHNLHYSFH